MIVVRGTGNEEDFEEKTKSPQKSWNWPAFSFFEIETMPEFEDGDLLLNFHDAVIYGSDLALVQSSNSWLNDACINFFMALLQQRSTSKTYKFMDPSVISFFVHQCTDDDEIQDFAQGNSFRGMDKIFIPVNDTMADTKVWRGGSHWTLLVIVKAEEKIEFWHFDSVRHSGNGSAARNIARKLGTQFFGVSLPTVVEAETPQQSNGYDCGVHMIAAAKIFSTMSEVDLKSHERNLRQYTIEHPNFCRELRSYIVDEIFRLSELS